MAEKKSVLYTKLVLFFAAIAFIFLIPVTAQAAVHYEGEKASGSDLYYIDNENSEYWVVTNGTWHQCEVFDSSATLDTVTSKVRSAMINRDSSISFYLVTDNENFNQKASSTTSAQDLNNQCINQIFDLVCNNVYNSTDNPASGDYLKMMSECRNSGASYRLSASDSCSGYSFFYISVYIGNNSTANQEQQVAAFVEEWTKRYIDANPTITASSGDTREYYIVKTIYNFIAKNTQYFTDLYKDVDHSKYPINGVDYLNAHNAYGALFGNIEGAEGDNFKYVEEKGDVLEYKYDMTSTLDAQSLNRIFVKNQGKAVCDGYSLLFYYMCRYNGIGCKIIIGDNADSDINGSDPHAWNMVLLKDYLDTDYEWYAVDTTFASQISQKISNEFTAVSYDYYLRGSVDTAFNSDNHQQPYDEYADIISAQSDNNYRFNISNIDESKLNIFVSRRRHSDSSELYVEDGKYNLENYIIIDPNNNYFKINEAKDNLQSTEGFTFYGTGYYYSFELYDFAKGIEYVCEDQYLLDVGEYGFNVSTTIGNKVYSKNIYIAPLNMSSWDTYDLTDSKINGNDLKDALDNEENLIINAEFIGSTITINTEIYDSTNKKLVEGTDYRRCIYVKGDSNHTPTAIKNPNTYIIRFEYMGNYTGVVEVEFVLGKADIGNIGKKDNEVINVDTTYGEDINNYISMLTLGNNNEKTQLVRGTDYEVLSIEGGTNYGDTGIITVRGLEKSKYIKGGTTGEWTYTVSKQRDLSEAFNGKVISNEKYCATGSPIKPDSFTMARLNSDGTRVDLVKDKDYIITGYSNNIKPGTGYVNVEFIGNYTGKATLSFAIVESSSTVSKTGFTYNGSVQRPTVTIKDASGKSLIYKTDFRVDYDNWSSTDAGTYKMYVIYMGKYSGRQTIEYTIKPATNVTATISCSSFTYTGSVQKPNVKVKNADGAVLSENEDYTVVYSNPASKEIGSYSLTVNMIGNYSGTKNFRYNIADRAMPQDYTFSKTSFVYNGRVQKPTVTVRDSNGRQMVYKTDFTVDYDNWSSTNAGTYKMYVNFVGNYSGIEQYVMEYTINPTNVMPTISLNRNTITMNGTVQRPSVTVKNGSTALVYKKDFIVTYSNFNSADIGRYTVTVTMIGNYSGSKTYPYYINPKPTEFLTSARGGFKALKRGFTLRWNKQATQTTGYQIQYSTRRDFKNAATVWVPNPNTLSKTITGRAGGKRYYVRIRTYTTVNGANFYSNWNSGTKSIVTLK